MTVMTIKDVGPIPEMEILIIPGHITELSGPNGSGKSTALKSVRRVVGVKESLTPRDGESSGSIEFGQVRITVGATTRGGAASIDNLEGKLSLGEMVDPGISDPVSADAKRVQALVSMLGHDVDSSVFYELLPGGEEEFRKVVSDSSLNKPDIVARVAAVKADLEAKARDHEKVVKNCENIGNSKIDSISGIDLDAPHDEAELEKAYLSARDKLTASKAIFNQQQKISADAQAARDRLKELSGEDLAQQHIDATSSLESASSEVSSLEAQRDELQEKLSQVVYLLGKATDKKRLAENDVSTINSKIDAHKSLLAAAQATVEGEVITQEYIDQLEEAEKAAKAANFAGQKIRSALKTRAEASAAFEEAQRNGRMADVYRSAAKGCESILAKVMEKSGVPVELRLVDGKPRLTIVDCIDAVEFIRPDKAGPTYFSDLSDGQRWQLAIRIAVGILKNRPVEQSVLVIEQKGWHDLDGRSKYKIRQMIEGTNVSIVTARCTQTVPKNDESEDSEDPEEDKSITVNII